MVTHRQNGQNLGVNRRNKTGYRGVYKHSDANKYVAQATIDGEKIYLGHYNTPEEADDVVSKYRAEHMDNSLTDKRKYGMID